MRMITKFDNENTGYIKECKACGYMYEEIFPKGGDYYEVVKGDEPFIELGLTTKKGNDYYARVEETRLYACPKCGTVHIEV